MTHTIAPGDVEMLEVNHRGGERYEIEVRGHRVTVDQPATSGGTDQAPTPTELFVVSLASCVAFYAGRYLTRHGFHRDGLQVRAGFRMAADRPARVAAIRIIVRPPTGFPADRVAALTAVVNHCTVHNSLAQPPEVVVRVG